MVVNAREKAETVLDLGVIRNARLVSYPFDYLIGNQFIHSHLTEALSDSFPDIAVTGFCPASELPLQGLFKQLVAELEGEPLTEVLSKKFGHDFSLYPRLVTIRKLSALHEGRIHCDGKSKVMSLLLYLNDNWEHKAGRLRVLYNADNINDYAAEISPEMGVVFAFMRADHSWHGHAPFVGERKVVQVAWVRSQEDIDRKKRRHSVSSWFKRWKLR